jgi:regulatory protein
MILTRLTAVGADGSRVKLWFDDGTNLRVAARLVTEQGLYQGMTLTQEDLANLLDAAQRASAKDRAVRIVSTTSISEKALKTRLIQRGERPEDAAQAVDWLRDLGALDDQAMAKRVVARCLGKGYGEARIRQELYAKGIPREFWAEALENLPDQSDSIDRFVAQRLRGRDPDQKELQRLTAALQRRGHSWEDIRRALRRYQEGLEESDFGNL